jgi:hypothetical protein
VADFLAGHGVETALVEHLDVADRWFDFLAEQDCGYGSVTLRLDSSAGRPWSVNPL